METEEGISKLLIKMLKTKISSIKYSDVCFLLLDEINLKTGINYNRKCDKVTGILAGSNKKINNALCIMARGIISKWKQPIGYYFSSGPMNYLKIREILEKAIVSMENEVFNVTGYTTDQGANFEKLSRVMGATPSHPYVTFQNKDYFVFKDPPHLIKNSRTFLLNNNIIVSSKLPKPAEWKHLQAYYEKSRRSGSLVYAPKLTHKHLYNLKFQNKMKVKLATQVISNSCSVALEMCVVNQELDSGALSTSIYCKKMNDIFDILNSSSIKAKVPLRKPISIGSKSYKEIEKMKSWLQELDKLNKGHKVKFIKGFIQSLNVVIQLLDKLHKHNIKYLSTRNLCQDPLENFFGRIRSLNKSPDSKQFEENFRRVAFTDLLSPVKLNISKSTNCEEVENEVKIVNMNNSYLEIANLLKKNRILKHIAIDYDEIFEFIEEENCLNIIKSEFEYSSTYISGYLVLKLNFLHKNDFNKSIKECEIC